MGILLGLFFIGLGYVIKMNPDLIAGYNTMPEQKKKNVDIAGLSSFMKKGMIVIGATLVVSYTLLLMTGYRHFFTLILLPVILGGVGYIVLKSQKFDRNGGRSRYVTIGLLALVLVFVLALTCYSFIPTRVIVTEEQVEFTGNYGLTLPKQEIGSVELAESIPEIKFRTNGISLGPVQKGRFRLDTWGSAHLLLNSFSGPYLVITRKNGERLVFRGSSVAETGEAFRLLK